MKRLVLIALFFVFQISLAAQSDRISVYDSIEIVLKSAKTDTATCFHFLRWVSNLGTSEHETAVRVSKWTINAAKKNGNKKCLAQAWYTLGRSYQVIDDFTTATKYFKTASELADKYHLYGLQGKLYSCFANTYSAVKQYELAREYYHKAIQIFKEHGFKEDLPGIYFNLASLEYEAKPDSNYVGNSLKCIHEALSTSVVEKNYDVVIYSWWLKAMIYSEVFKSDSSLIFLDKAYSIAQQYKYTDFYPNYFSFKGILLRGNGKFNEAIAVFQQGLKEAEKNNSQLSIYNLYGELANAYALKGDYKSAFNYQHLHKMYYDSVVNTENFAKLNEMETQLALERKDKLVLKATNEKQKAKLLLQDSEQRQENLWFLIISIGIIVIILGVFLFILLQNIRSRKEAYIKLQQKNIEIQQQGQELIRLSNEITRYQTQMNPHFVFNALNSIQGFVVNNEKEKTLQQLGNFSRLMRTTLNHSNHELISLDEELEFLKTFIAFEQERFKNKILFTVIVNTDIKETMIPPMMIQPLLENALKHARLGDINDAEIKLEIKLENNNLKIKVADNGRGITGNKNTLIKESHSMAIIQSRIKLLFSSEKTNLPEAYFKILSIPEIPRGTCIEFYLPFITKF